MNFDVFPYSHICHKVMSVLLMKFHRPKVTFSQIKIAMIGSKNVTIILTNEI